MMKKILLYIGVILAAIDCTKDPDVSQSGDNVVTITSNITTRVASEQWETNDEIGVYMTSSDFGDKGANAEYITADGNGAFSASSTPLYLPSSGDVEIFAYYPYCDFENTDGATISAYPINSEYQVDLLSAKNENVTTAAVKMSFNHLLSKVSLTIAAGDGMTLSDFADLGIKLSGITTTANINILDPTLSSLTNSDGELTLEPVITKNDEETAIIAVSSSVIVIPQTLNDATLYFTTKDYGTFSATISTEKFDVGNEYKYTATLNRDGVVLSEANIDKWNTNTDSGTADIVDIEYKNGKYYINSAKGLAAFSDLVYGAGSNTKSATFAGFEESTFESSNTAINGVLTRDIDLGDIYYEGGSSWNPIGRNLSGISYHYEGTFDGGGYKVSNLYINATSQQALFGFVAEGGVVCNLGVSGEVTGCSDGEAYQAAGIAANNDGNIFNCYSEVNVTGDTNVGGIVGHNYDQGRVVNCYNHGSVVGSKNNVGGIVGQNEVGGYIGYCYSIGDIELDASVVDNRRVGGVVGWNHTSTDSDGNPTVKGSFCKDNTEFSIGQVSLTGDGTNGLTGNVCADQYLKSTVFATVINNGAWTYNYDYASIIGDYTKAWAWKYNDGGYPSLVFYEMPEYDETVYDIVYNSGTYQIYTALGLKVFAALVNKETLSDEDAEVVVTSGGDAYFKNIYGTANPNIKGRLVKDIDLGGIDSEGTVYAENAWTPIGTSSSTPFSGTFDGNSKMVSGLYINSKSECQGLFGYINGTINNLGVDGSVSGNWFVGGVVGYNYGGSISNCYNGCGVSGDLNVGGVVGWNYVGTLTNCYNKGDVKGSDSVGGVVGLNSSSGSPSSTVTIINCYNTGEVSGSVCVGDVAGYNYGTITLCYWNSEISKIDDGVGTNSATADVTGYTTIDMQAESFVTTLNNNAYTYNEENPDATQACAWVYNKDDYPSLDFDTEPTYTIDITYNDDGIYEIYTANGLCAFADLVNNVNPSINGVLMSDIDMEGTEWIPIGTFDNQYSGIFDGDGYLVSGSKVSSDVFAGIFGYSCGIISNLRVEGSTNGSNNACGVVGYNNGGTISDCCNTGDVSSDMGIAGGVVGLNYGTITNCYNTGNVSSEIGGAGGVAGANYGTIISCYNTNGVDGEYAGGVVGMNEGALVNCYNAGDVSGEMVAGGVSGNNSGAFTNCYNTGYVIAESTTGGVVGDNIGTITNCYWDSTVYNGSGVGGGSGSATGMSTTAMQASSFVTTLNDNVYSYISNNPHVSLCLWKGVNNDYPTLDFDNTVASDEG